jgi:geranylgeranylglyceryl phosphate synthase family protein
VSPLTASRLPLDERGGLVVLVDPGRTSPGAAGELARRAADGGVCALLVGDSVGGSGDPTAHVDAMRACAPELAIVQFPASAEELSASVDAVLFLTLLSGRNPRYLVEEQVRAATFFDQHPEVVAISTAYLLIDGGRVSAVETVTGTRPLPADRPDVVAAHVTAGRLMGMRATYLEAGSGAERPVPPRIIAAARESSAGPLFVGGGVTTPAAARNAREAGADYVVVGTLFERDPAAAVQALAMAARA